MSTANDLQPYYWEEMSEEQQQNVIQGREYVQMRRTLLFARLAREWLRGQLEGLRGQQGEETTVGGDRRSCQYCQYCYEVVDRYVSRRNRELAERAKTILSGG